MEVSRKQFLLLLAGTAAAACGGSGGGSSPSGNCEQNGTSSSIANNHGHVLTVSKADVLAGVDKTYDITGSATHSHQVTLTAADFASLQQNLAANETSTIVESHSHAIKVSCV